MLQAAGQGFRSRAGERRRVVQQRLLDLAELGHQQQVAGQGMAWGELAQARGAHTEQIAPRQVEEGRDIGRGFDLAGFEYLA
ncbi:hypothetical protein D9M69_734860 [compost metagenome]